MCAALAEVCHNSYMLSLTQNIKAILAIYGAVDKTRHLYLEYFEENKSSAHVSGWGKLLSNLKV